MPALTANTAIVVNAGGTALGNTVGTLALGGNLSVAAAFTVSGAFATTLVAGAVVTITLPLVSGTLATLAGAEELTNKTLTASVAKGVWTASGTWTLPAVTLGGAITYGGVTLTNAVTGTGKMVLDTAPTVSQPNLVGTTTNNSAAAGSVGEFVTSAQAIAATGLTNNVASTTASISLTAGDWDVWIDALFDGDPTTVVDRVIASLSTVNSTLDNNTGNRADVCGFHLTPFQYSRLCPTVGPVRVSLAGTTTYYFVSMANFTVSNCGTGGVISARRRR